MPSSARSDCLPSHPTLWCNPPNRRIRTRMYGGVGGEEPRGSPLSRLLGANFGVQSLQAWRNVCTARDAPLPRLDGSGRHAACPLTDALIQKRIEATIADLGTHPGRTRGRDRRKDQAASTARVSGRQFQVGASFAGMTGQSRQDICEPALRINVVELAIGGSPATFV